LFAVTHAVDAPVLMRDWILHPLQIVDAKEAGAAGVLGVITSVMGDGTGAAWCPASMTPFQQIHLPRAHVFSEMSLVLLTLQPF
jgi:Indole-3-glycerol phosphate synthase